MDALEPSSSRLNSVRIVLADDHQEIPQLRIEAPETQIVMITMEHGPAMASAALRAGALAYVFKDAADGELFEAIRHAAAGQRHVNRQLSSLMARERIRSSGWD